MVDKDRRNHLELCSKNVLREALRSFTDTADGGDPDGKDCATLRGAKNLH